jgi:HrpA-like RNA helicase
MQWMQNPSESNVENLNKVRRDANRHLRNKKKAYMKAKIEAIIIRFITEKREGDVLVFLSGERMIKDCMNRLARLLLY